MAIRKYQFNLKKEDAPDNPELADSEDTHNEYNLTVKSLDKKFVEAKDTKRKNMVPENYKTILQLSREMGVDKQRVYRYIKLKNISFNVFNKIIYIDSAVQSKIIYDFRKLNDAVKKRQKSTSKSTSIGTKKGASKDMLKMYYKDIQESLKVLKNELSFKAEQLQEKDQQIMGLTKIIESMAKGSHQ